MTATGAVTINGGAGSDTISLNAAVDGSTVAVYGGRGSDQITINATGSTPITVDGQAGDDRTTVQARAGGHGRGERRRCGRRDGPADGQRHGGRRDVQRHGPERRDRGADRAGVAQRDLHQRHRVPDGAGPGGQRLVPRRSRRRAPRSRSTAGRRRGAIRACRRPAIRWTSTRWATCSRCAAGRSARWAAARCRSRTCCTRTSRTCRWRRWAPARSCSTSTPCRRRRPAGTPACCRRRCTIRRARTRTRSASTSTRRTAGTCRWSAAASRRKGPLTGAWAAARCTTSCCGTATSRTTRITSARTWRPGWYLVSAKLGDRTIGAGPDADHGRVHQRRAGRSAVHGGGPVRVGVVRGARAQRPAAGPGVQRPGRGAELGAEWVGDPAGQVVRHRGAAAGVAGSVGTPTLATTTRTGRRWTRSRCSRARRARCWSGDLITVSTDLGTVVASQDVAPSIAGVQVAVVYDSGLGQERGAVRPAAADGCGDGHDFVEQGGRGPHGLRVGGLRAAAVAAVRLQRHGLADAAAGGRAGRAGRVPERAADGRVYGGPGYGWDTPLASTGGRAPRVRSTGASCRCRTRRRRSCGGTGTGVRPRTRSRSICRTGPIG